MILKNKFFLLIFFFILLTTYNSNEEKKNFSIIFPIKKIEIKDTLAFDSTKLRSELEFLRNTSLFFLKEKEITKVIDKYDFISTIQLKKKYPNTLKITIIEKVPVATQIIDRKKFYITKDNKKINFTDLKIYSDLPIIFGKYKNFDIFYNDLKTNNFKVNEIKAFYYFDVGRWDIVLKNEKAIKFPEKNYLNLLPKINLMLRNNNFSKYKVFDFRIQDQLILQ